MSTGPGSPLPVLSSSFLLTSFLSSSFSSSPGLAVAALVLATAVAFRRALTHRGLIRARGRLSPPVSPAGVCTPAVGPAPYLRRMLAPPPWLVAGLVAMGVDTDARLVGRGWLTAVLLAVAAGATAGPGLATVTAIAGVIVPGLCWLLWRHRGDARYEAGLPAALDAVAAALRSGASLHQAIGEAATAGPLLDDLRDVAVRARTTGLVSSLEAWARHRPLPGVRLAVAALCLAAEAGGAPARAVEGVAATLRQRTALAAEVKAQAAQARLSAVVIALAPIAFCLLATATDPRTADLLFRTPTGLLFLTVGLGLDAVAVAWMARITRAAA